MEDIHSHNINGCWRKDQRHAENIILCAGYHTFLLQLSYLAHLGSHVVSHNKSI